jgi:transcriptional regulator with XRE-family HTH domain
MKSINYAEQIRKYRDEKGYTQEFMAHQLNIKQNSYSNIENGKTKIKAEILEKIAEIFAINPIKLLQNAITKDDESDSIKDSRGGGAAK